MTRNHTTNTQTAQSETVALRSAQRDASLLKKGQKQYSPYRKERERNPRGKSSFSFLLCFSFLLLFASCQPDVCYHSFLPVSIDEWEVTDTLRFDLPAMPDDSTHYASIGVRVTEKMPYRSLRLVLEQRAESHRLRDTLTLPLASEHGKWFRQGTALHDFESEAVMLRLPMQDSSQILIYHIMPRQSLPGVAEAGVKVAKSPFSGIARQKNFRNIWGNHQK